MRFSARAAKTLPRTWFMSVTVLSLPEREANSAASLSDSRSCCSSWAWRMQRVGWPFLRSMRQERPSVNSRRHLLLFGSSESDFIGDLRKEGFATEARRTRRQRTGRKLSRGMLLRCVLWLGAKLYGEYVTEGVRLLSR